MATIHPFVPKEESVKVALVCSACGAVGQGSCLCGAAYVPPGERAAKAEAANPKRSARAIADEAGVGKDTVRRARNSGGAHAPTDRVIGKDNKSYPAKKRGRPRKQERPHKSDPTVQQQAAVMFLDGGMTREQVQIETGLGPHEVQLAVERERGRREAFAEVKIDPTTFSMTARQKLDAAIRTKTKEIEREYDEKRIKANIEHWARHFPEMRKKENEASERERTYREFMAQQKKIFSADEYTAIIRCLHPDSRGTVSDGKLADAFRLFKAKKFALTGEK